MMCTTLLRSGGDFRKKEAFWPNPGNKSEFQTVDKRAGAFQVMGTGRPDGKDENS